MNSFLLLVIVLVSTLPPGSMIEWEGEKLTPSEFIEEITNMEPIKPIEEVKEEEKVEELQPKENLENRPHKPFPPSINV